MPLRPDSPQNRIRIELVRSLFATTAPSLIMSLGFVICAWLICVKTPEPGLVLLAIAGGAASVVRIAIVMRHLKEARADELSAYRATLLERRFAVSYLGFAIILGLFSARVLTFGSPETHMLAICLVVGYAAGVAAGAGLRPRIAVPSMLAAVVPSATAALLANNEIYWATGIMLSAFLAGGVHSLLNRFKTMSVEIGQRITLSGLARRDALTGLPNRLALREWFDAKVLLPADKRIVAVHCLDLDGFKPINDMFGHPAGDNLLRAVSSRLTGSLRSGDMAARMGGDEFVVIQSELGHPDEAQLLAQRLCKSIGAPFEIGGQRLHVSTSVGFVTSEDRAEDLDSLLALADEALYAAKRTHGSFVPFERRKSGAQTSIAA